MTRSLQAPPENTAGFPCYCTGQPWVQCLLPLNLGQACRAALSTVIIHNSWKAASEWIMAILPCPWKLLLHPLLIHPNARGWARIIHQQTHRQSFALQLSQTLAQLPSSCWWCSQSHSARNAGFEPLSQGNQRHFTQESSQDLNS